jgi:hypothetical protein
MRIEYRETTDVLAGLVAGLLLVMLFLFSMMGGSGFVLAILVLAMLPIGLGIAAFGNPKPVETTYEAVEPVAQPFRRSFWQASAVGAVAVMAMLGIYIGIMTTLEGSTHTVQHLRAEWLSVIEVMGLFGVLTAIAFESARRHSLSAGLLALGVFGSGLGMLGLLACCIPLLFHLVPSVTILQAGVFMIQYATPIIIVGIAFNLASEFAMLRARQATG